MRTKDYIAAWVLVIWLVVTGSKPFFTFEESLQAGAQVGTIVWNAFEAIVVSMVGIFLICHYISTIENLRYYEGLENRRQRLEDTRPDVTDDVTN